MPRRMLAASLAAAIAGATIATPAHAQVNVSALLYWTFCKRKLVEVFEPQTGITVMREKVVCNFPSNGDGGGGDD